MVVFLESYFCFNMCVFVCVTMSLRQDVKAWSVIMAFPG